MSLFSSLRRTAVASAAIVVALPAAAQDGIIDLSVTTRPITEFRIGRKEQDFGDFTFAGGAEMTASSRHFGALSGIELYPDQSHFIAVTDTGFWVEGRIERGADESITGLSDVTMRDIATLADGAPRQKWETDAEGIALDGTDVLVSYERKHRVERFRREADGALTLVETIIPPVDLNELRQNRGFEGIAIAPATTDFPGALVAVSEKSLDRNGDIMAFVYNRDGSSFEFSVKRVGEFDVTDLAFLPDGDLLVLERKFNVTDSLAIRIRRFANETIVDGAAIDGAVVLEADLLYQIDNMEGLSLTLDGDGTPRITMVSDDNHSLLQRNLMLEFTLRQ